MTMTTTSDGTTPREQLIVSFDGWADNMRELLDAVRPALMAMDYETAALAFEGMARGATSIGARVREEADRRRAAGW
jgi:hypothetical protein